MLECDPDAEMLLINVGLNFPLLKFWGSVSKYNSLRRGLTGPSSLAPATSVQILAGKIRMEFLPTVSLTQAFPARIVQDYSGLCRAFLCGDDSSHSQSQSGKGSSWPPEAIPYRVPYTMGLVLTLPIIPAPWT